LIGSARSCGPLLILLFQNVTEYDGIEEKTMSDQQLLERIACDAKIMVGKPVIKGTRLTVEFILNLLAHGTTNQEILKEYEGLTEDDIQACLLFASQSLSNTSFMPLVSEPV
jgi:uncharacterized protein (DUF433 family)